MWLLLLVNMAFGRESADGPIQSSTQHLNVDAFEVGVRPRVFVSLGATSGLSVSSQNGGFVGLETAVSRVNGNRLVGLSGDVLWDSGLGGFSSTVGPRVGLLVVAVDGGISVRQEIEGTPEVGAQVRTLLNLGIGTMYYRVGFWPESEDLSTVHQLGVSLRFPQQIGYKPRTGEE
tara:strand:+ start:209 stop:733 length:525 start_codon:yes stop_codon:yes gene_type:complete